MEKKLCLALLLSSILLVVYLSTLTISDVAFTFYANTPYEGSLTISVTIECSGYDLANENVTFYNVVSPITADVLFFSIQNGSGDLTVLSNDEIDLQVTSNGGFLFVVGYVAKPVEVLLDGVRISEVLYSNLNKTTGWAYTSNTLYVRVADTGSHNIVIRFTAVTGTTTTIATQTVSPSVVAREFDITTAMMADVLAAVILMMMPLIAYHFGKPWSWIVPMIVLILSIAMFGARSVIACGTEIVNGTERIVYRENPFVIIYLAPLGMSIVFLFLAVFGIIKRRIYEWYEI